MFTILLHNTGIGMINNMFEMVKGNPGMIRQMVGMAPGAQGASWLTNASDESFLEHRVRVFQ